MNPTVNLNPLCLALNGRHLTLTRKTTAAYLKKAVMATIEYPCRQRAGRYHRLLHAMISVDDTGLERT